MREFEAPRRGSVAGGSSGSIAALSPRWGVASAPLQRLQPRPSLPGSTIEEEEEELMVVEGAGGAAMAPAPAGPPAVPLPDNVAAVAAAAASGWPSFRKCEPKAGGAATPQMGHQVRPENA